MTNIVSASAFSFAAAVATFCIDINKDMILAGGGAPAAASALQFTVNWLGIPLAIILVLVGIVAQVKRGAVIERVMRESQNADGQ
ncbi:hypothetical protein ABMA32_17595 [Mesorhizobium sp. VNQ89]|uniref:hypothetical protein n=1 Tax=Mesorhizobium quangtriensis TaxID=3157709 RepID=UPI0032B86525